jgi:tetratricopeptide (TPR) repeat protein
LSVNKLSAAFYIIGVKTHFKKAATLDPTHTQAREALVELYMQLPSIIGGSQQTALFYADELAQLSPEKGYLAKGYIADYAGDTIAAEQFYKKAVAVQGSMVASAKLVGFYKKTNQINKALQVLKQSLTLNGQQNQLNYQIGELVARYTLDSKLGIEALKRYLENYSTKDNTSQQWAYLRLAQVYKNTGDKIKALFWVDKALRVAPEFKEAAKEKILIQLL